MKLGSYKKNKPSIYVNICPIYIYMLMMWLLKDFNQNRYTREPALCPGPAIFAC